MPYFFCKLNPPRASFAMDMNQDEARLMGEHAVYWRAHALAGSAVVFGPVGDPKGPWGLGIVEVSSLADARALTAGDPAIAAGIGLAYEIYPMLSAIVRQQAAANPVTS